MNIKKWSQLLALAILAGVMLTGVDALSQTTNQAIMLQDKADSTYRAIGFGLAAAFAVAFSIMGAAYAVARIGSAAIGALVEKPELLAKTILFVALAEGLAVLGFAVAMMLLQKI